MTTQLLKSKTKSMLQNLHEAIFVSGPSCVLLLFSLRDLLWGLSYDLFGYNFKTECLAFFNSHYHNVFTVIGLLGLLSILLGSSTLALVFSTVNVFLYGLIAYTLFHCTSNSLDGINYIFEMFAVIWLVFRIQYDKYNKETLN